eukprot:CAMPEP_0201953164 /NCGR_PEP_ID=MMETSP0904-20121228/1635_1 /ASSEMBLY_ACC=CAM_ASM_000553 /TAXON_ID=420261 /ORGANISM="Thalassiosira antarctica, Strain CCMP982" /LENGTH=303 /DNA_ID=CAMNT_0048496981 /DNA_START=27 /DNA_END=938 /DNA_ORIENTATION=-
MSDKKGKKEVEMDIFNRFSRIVKEKFTGGGDNGGAKINQLDALYKQPEFSTEKRILNEMNSVGLYKGVLSGLACFAFLRISPGAMSRMFRRRAGVGAEGGTANPFKQSSGYKLDPPGANPNPGRPGILFRLVRLSLDSFVSVSIGAYASMWFVDKDKMMNQFASIPLVEGRSLLSEALCEDFTREFQKFDRQTWYKNHPSLSDGGYSDDDGDTDFRYTIQGFVANCRRRAIYEEEMRKERGLTNSEPVVIPSPGVPRDISVSLDDLIDEKEFGGESDNPRSDSMGSGDDYFDTYFDTGDGKQD